MSTETQPETETDAEPSLSSIDFKQTVVEPIAAAGLVGSAQIQYALAILVLHETVGGEFATAPVWFIVGLNTALAIPIVLPMVLFATYFISIFDDNAPSYRDAIIWGTAGTIVLTPPFFGAFELGVL